MTYNPDYGPDFHRRHRNLPLEPIQTAEPTDEVRRLVRKHLEQHPHRINSPSRIEAALRHAGVTVPVAQIAGALAEARGEASYDTEAPF